MTKRVWMTAGRILMAKAGYTADAALADANKTFDSDWGFTGTLLASGRYIDTAPTPPVGTPGTSSPRTVVIPLPFTPREVGVFIRKVPSPTSFSKYENGAWVDGSNANAQISGYVSPYGPAINSEGDTVRSLQWSYSAGVLSYYRLSYRRFTSSESFYIDYQRGDFLYQVFSL